ncbi:major facilitator superfamily transporter [Colletotrichum sojae]|uniref:Major facilitator superfamily transporter n=1 Tax=Colletotrichum sojae TaxID=2175907 RepID=A0A8H6IUX6_9PEZI|nr:major facilitator superfamily transporter [Colletotrichum sojae]
MAAKTEPIPLETASPSEDYSSDEVSDRPIPPLDGGAGAWRFLVGAFVVEAVLWGFPLSYGVFQDYYSIHPNFKHDNNIAIIGTAATSIYYLGGPLATPFVAQYQKWQRHMAVAGWLSCVVALVAASFTDSVPGLIATQGVLYGFSFLFLSYPILRMLNEWFVRRRGLAFGVMSAGAGCSGVGFPFLLELLLARYGYQTTLRAVAVAQFVTVLPVIPLLKGRLPASARQDPRRIDTGFLRKPLFYCFALSNLFQGLGYHIPSLYLPTYATSLGLPGAVGALILAASNLATIFGQLGFGYVSDRVRNVLILVFASSSVAAVASFLIWGYVSSLASLLAFSLIYSFSAGGYLCLWQRFGSILSEDPVPVYSIMALGKGIGNILTGPITAPLMTGKLDPGYSQGRFGPLIIFLGSMMLGSSMGILGWPFFPKAKEAEE